jgi:Lar family restriction alleviation protein
MKPCPFCGSSEQLPSYHDIEGVRVVAVACDECEAEGPTVAIDGEDQTAAAYDEARALWNKRN